MGKASAPWVDEFNMLTQQDNLKYPHQVAGWKDILSVDEWDEYVGDVIQDRVNEGMSIFEAGCGTLAFLESVQRICGEVKISGIDAAEQVLQHAKQRLAPATRDRFQVGIVPDALQNIPDASFDIVLCNSVFQYLPNLEVAETAIWEMLRISKTGGKVIVADLCDEKRKEANERKMHALWERYGTDDKPAFLYFSKEWFNRFGERLVCLRHVEVESYQRRDERFVVYLEKKH